MSFKQNSKSPIALAMKSVDPPRKTLSLNVEHQLSSDSHSESPVHPNNHVISDHDHQHTEHEDTHHSHHSHHTNHTNHTTDNHIDDDDIDLLKAACAAGDIPAVEPLSDEIINSALGIKLDPNYKHRPLSPTPYSRDHTGIDDSTNMHEIQPLKTSSYSHLIMPSMHSLHGGSLHGGSLHGNPTANLTDTLHFYAYIESIVIKHVNQSNATINHHHPINLNSVKKTLNKLKLLLLHPESDTIVTWGDDEEIHIANINSIHAKKSVEMEIIDESKQHGVSPMAVTPSGHIHYAHNANGQDTHHQPKNQVAIIKDKSEKEAQINPERMKWCTHSTRSLWGVFIPSSALLHHPQYSIDVNKYCGKCRGSVRQDWNTIETDDDEERNWEELKPHWFELFFDLMFVAAIVHISTEVAYEYEKYHNYMFIVTVFAQFGLLILCWLEQVLYYSRFRMTQTFDGFLRFIYMALVLMMGLSISPGNQTSQKIFLISYLFTKFIMIIMFIKAAFIPRARNHSIYMMTENIITIITVIFIEVYVNVPDNEYKDRQWIWTLIYTVLFAYSWTHMVVLVYTKCIRDHGVNIPINVPHIAERMGAFVLIIMGETIISIMVQHVDATINGILTAYIITMSFFLIVYCIGKLYFESQPTEYELHHHRKVHALSKSVWRARIYKWFHILLFFGLLGLGLGSKITIHGLEEEGGYHGDDKIYVWLPGLSCVVICICINIIRLTHPFDYSEKHPHLVCGVWIVRIAVIALMFGILFAWDLMDHSIILGIYNGCFLIQIFVDFEANHRLFMAKAEDKEKSKKWYKSPKAANAVTYSPKNELHGIIHDDDDHDHDAEDHKYPRMHSHNGHDSHYGNDSHLGGREITITKELSFIGTF